MRSAAGLALLCLAAACASVPEDPPPAPTGPVGIVVTPLDKGRTVGGEAVYAVEAPLELVLREVLDFRAQASYRPTVLEATPIETRPEGGIVAFRFRGDYGFEPNATCNYTVTREETVARIRYEMSDPSLALWALRGGFDLTPLSPGRTLIRQEFLVSALVMDRAKLLASLREDAKAIADHMEAVAAAATK